MVNVKIISWILTSYNEVQSNVRSSVRSTVQSPVHIFQLAANTEIVLDFNGHLSGV